MNNTHSFNSPSVGDITVHTLEELSLSEMGTLYGELTGRPVERFSCRDVGIVKCAQALMAHFEEKTASMFPHGHTVDYPFRGFINDAPCRGLRKILMRLLEQEATVEEFLELVPDLRVLRSHLYMLHHDRGYGIKEEKGRIRLVKAPHVLPCGARQDAEPVLAACAENLVNRAVPIPTGPRPEPTDDDIVMPPRETPIHIHKIELQVSQDLIDRLRFLLKNLLPAPLDEEEVILRAIEHFDRAACACLEGAKVEAHHRNNTLEDLTVSTRKDRS